MTRLSDRAVAALREGLDAPNAGPRYVVHEQLGRGGMGTVYRAHDVELQRDVALKVLSLDAEMGALSARLAREAQTLARLEHPGIVAVHDTGVLEDGRPFYVMRLVRGATLDRATAALPMGDALRLFLRVCDAVAFAHARGVIHRDLKPANIMLGEYGDVLVLDWGVAALLDGAGPGATATAGDASVAGTPGYMAPEQRTAAAAVDGRADVFGLGVILGYLTVRPHATAATGGGAGGGASAGSARQLAAIVARASASVPADRYDHVGDLAADVRRWLDGETVTAYREHAGERALRLYRRNRVIVLMLVSYAVVRVVLLLWRGV